jgi:D-xylose 1-dehydrogenase
VTFTRYESLEGRTVVVTGGASGIGAAFVRAFAANEGRVAFLDVQTDVGAALAGAIGREAETPLFVPCDLTDIAALRSTPCVRRSVRRRCWSTTRPTIGATISPQ